MKQETQFVFECKNNYTWKSKQKKVLIEDEIKIETE